MRISDWSSDVCSSDLQHAGPCRLQMNRQTTAAQREQCRADQQAANERDAPAALCHRALTEHGRCEDAADARNCTARPQQQCRGDADQRTADCGVLPGEWIDNDIHLWPSGRCRDMPRGYTRSEEHTSELQSLMRISYAVFCLQKK